MSIATLESISDMTKGHSKHVTVTLTLAATKRVNMDSALDKNVVANYRKI